MSCVLEMLNLGVDWEESIPKEEYEFQEGTELDCSPLTHALGLFTRAEAEEEAKLNQDRDVTFLVLGVVETMATMDWIMPRGADFSCLAGGSSML